ncbi:BTAD domain-containing putative transcriptional regulator [Streptomyces sp. CA-250714]|uniref:BTAD domain-containing putative transcriptional regulator n=1 Tax=Streptomyces sp. CA-250714 TaxID=3240060 RepID=UPI003D8C94B4
MWGVADSQLGDPTKWRQIAEDNRDVVSDPNVIHPGDKLALPSQQATPPGQDTPPPPPEKKPQKQDQDKGENQGQDTKHETPDKQVPAPDREQTPDSPHKDLSPEPSPSREHASKASADAPDTTDTGAAVSTLMVTGGVVAAGVIGGLFVRRALQQRRRRRGRRIPMPQGKAAQTEADLRAAEPLVDLQLLAQVLRTAAAHLAEEERPFPTVRAVVLGRTIDLYLGESAPPGAPFAAAGNLERWTCPVTTKELLSADELDEVDLPLPGLVTLGATAEDQRLVLVDLESIGVLHLTGPARHVVARSLAVELALTPLADAVEVQLSEDLAPGLASVCERLTSHQELSEDVVGALRAHHAEQQRALTVLGVESLRAARLTAAGAGGWTPHVVLADAGADPAAAATVGEVARQEPRTATAVIITAEEHADAGEDDTGWSLHTSVDGAVVVVPGTEVACVPHVIGDEDYQDIVELLATADADQDEPAREQGRPDPLPRLDVSVFPEGEMPRPRPGDIEQPRTKADEGDEEGPQPSPAPENRQAGTPQPNVIAQLADLGLAEPAEGDKEGAAADEPTARPGATPLTSEPAPTSGSDDSKDAPDLATTQPPAAPTSSHDEASVLVRVLGSVEIEGARGKVETKRRRAATELVAFLACNRGVERPVIEEALWRGRSVQRRTVTELISRTRGWLGTRPDGSYFFPVIADADSRYSLEGVSLDWKQFQELAAYGERTSGEQGTRALRQALELVRGRPFAGVPPFRYGWAEPLIQDMISEIVDAAEILAERYMVQGRAREALWAAVKGLEAAPEAEQLRRHQFTALHALGDMDSLQRAVAELDALNDALGVEADEATLETLRNLMSSA